MDTKPRLNQALRIDPMGDIDDHRLGTDPYDHAFHDAGVSVLTAKISREGDDVHTAYPLSRNITRTSDARAA